MFPDQKSIGIYHVPVVAGQKQPYPGSADVTTSALFLPMDRREHALEGGDFDDPHELYLDPSVDIRVGDKVVIDAVNFYVKKVFKASHFGGLRHQRAAVSRASHA